MMKGENDMKRTLIFTLLVTLLISSLLSVGVFAVEETEVSLVPENFGISSNAATKNALIWNDDESVTAKNVALFGIALPETVHKGDSVVVHIKGVSDGDFRVWLLGAGEATCSNQYKFSEHGYTSGEFDKIIEFTFQDFIE